MMEARRSVFIMLALIVLVVILSVLVFWNDINFSTSDKVNYQLSDLFKLSAVDHKKEKVKTVSKLNNPQMCQNFNPTKNQKDFSLNEFYVNLLSLVSKKVKVSEVINFVNIHSLNKEGVISKSNIEVATGVATDVAKNVVNKDSDKEGPITTKEEGFSVRIYREDPDLFNNDVLFKKYKFLSYKEVKKMIAGLGEQVFIEKAVSILQGPKLILSVVIREDIVAYIESPYFRLLCDALFDDKIDCFCI